MLQIKKRINWKIFIGYGLASTFASCAVMAYVAPGIGPLISVLVFYLATAMNQLIIAEIGFRRFAMELGETQESASGITVLLMISKWGVLLLAVVISIQFITTEIFIPLANYLAHIAILAKSIKRLA